MSIPEMHKTTTARQSFGSRAFFISLSRTSERSHCLPAALLESRVEVEWFIALSTRRGQAVDLPRLVRFCGRLRLLCSIDQRSIQRGKTPSQT